MLSENTPLFAYKDIKDNKTHLITFERLFNYE